MIAGRTVALANLPVLDAPFPDVVDVAADAGFGAVTLRVCQGTPGQETALVTDPDVHAETVRRLADRGLGVLDVEVVRLAEDTDVAALRPVLDAAARLGAVYVLCTGTTDDEDVLTDRFAAICEEGAALGLRCALEFMVFSGCKTVEAAARVVERAGHPAGVVLVDPLHLRRSGGGPGDVAACVAAHPERFPYAQLCDAPLQAPGDDVRSLYGEAVRARLNPGDGELPLRALLDALPAGVPLSVETPVLALADRSPAERARAAFQTTRRLLEGAA
jgi:sugar phosphate isomerase/epimerase